MKTIVVLISLLVVGCGEKYLTRAETIQAVNECKDAGFYPHVIQRPFESYKVVAVHCLPWD